MSAKSNYKIKSITLTTLKGNNREAFGDLADKESYNTIKTKRLETFAQNVTSLRTPPLLLPIGNPTDLAPINLWTRPIEASHFLDLGRPEVQNADGGA